MVFTRTCDATHFLALVLRNLGLRAIPINGHMSQVKLIFLPYIFLLSFSFDLLAFVASVILFVRNCLSLCHWNLFLQSKRLGALNKFKAGECNILICTDVASRGLDIPSVDMVVNYDIPTNSKVAYYFPVSSCWSRPRIP